MEKRIILDEQDMNEFTKVFAKTIEDEAIKQIEVLYECYEKIEWLDFDELK